jgi:hypothetical protein
MWFWADEKYALLVWRKICDLERISAVRIDQIGLLGQMSHHAV